MCASCISATAAAVDAFEGRFNEIATADGLVIDVRDNGGGNSGEGYRLLSTLTDKPFRTSRWRTREYLPAYRAWSRPEGVHAGDAGEVMPDGKRHYAGPVLVLTSARHLLSRRRFRGGLRRDGTRRASLAKPTGGSTGQPLLFDLPGGGKGRICTKRDSYPDGREFVGVGVQPQVVVSPRVADLQARTGYRVAKGVGAAGAVFRAQRTSHYASTDRAEKRRPRIAGPSIVITVMRDRCAAISNPTPWRSTPSPRSPAGSGRPSGAPSGSPPAARSGDRCGNR